MSRYETWRARLKRNRVVQDLYGLYFRPAVCEFRAWRDARWLARHPLVRQDVNASLRPGVNLIGDLSSERGVAQAARATCLALEAAGISHERCDLASPEHWKLPHRVNLFHLNADQLLPLYRRLGPTPWQGRTNLGFWFWEVSEFPRLWDAAFQLLDGLWAASNFVRDAIAPAAPWPIQVVPLALDSAPRAEADDPESVPSQAMPIDERRPFTFLSILDLDSVADRKNPRAAAVAFQTAFGDRRDVRLILKLGSVGHHRRPVERLKRSIGAARIELVEARLPREQLLQMIRDCDAYLSLHRSEGYGLGIAEAMSLGKPVIATGYSGNLDFMPPEITRRVEYRLTPVGAGRSPYPRKAVWAEPSIDDAAQAMRELVADPEQARAKGAQAARWIRDQLSPAAVGRIVAGHLAAYERRDDG